MVGTYDFDFESFKKKLLKEIGDKTRQIVRDMMAKMIKKMPFNEEDTETRTILGKPLKEKLKAPVDSTEPEWIKDMKRKMNQLQTAMKNHGLNPDFANVDMDLEKKRIIASKMPIPKYEEVLWHG